MRLITIGITGVTGAMGGEVLSHLMEAFPEAKIKVLVRNYKKRHLKRFISSLLRKGKNQIEVIDGSLEDKDIILSFVKDCDYIIHNGAMIPPKADHDEEQCYKSNFIGTKNIVDSIEESGQAEKTKLVHISTVALYGNRDSKHPWARMGDPVMVSAYDYYGASKARAEHYVLESNIKNWVVLRQTGILHKYFLTNNLNDGLMFHTVWNGPLDWVTDRDSGLMIEHLVEKDLKGQLEGFWCNDYNITGGPKCRETGYETFKAGFDLMGGAVEDFFNPNWNIPRNFHGVWYTDENVLNDWLDYQSEDLETFWKRMRKIDWYFKFGKIIPVKLLRKIVIERLLSNSNAPMKWINDNDEGKIKAFWGSREEFEKIPSTWENYPLLCKGKDEKGKPLDYKKLLESGSKKKYILNHGYDEKKKDEELTLKDMKEAAAFRAGKCLSRKMKKGDLQTKLEWKCHNGHTFTAKPFTVLKAGFWCPECCLPGPIWQYDKLSQKIPFYAQVHYDTHSKKEDNVYPLGEE